MRTIMAIAALATLLSLAACDNNDSSQDTNSRATTSEKTGKASTAGEGAMTDGGATAPPDTKSTASADSDGRVELPDYLSVYPDATVISRKNGTGDPSASGGSITFTTSDSPDKVVAFYKSQAEGAGGMHQTMHNSNGGSALYIAVNVMTERGFHVDATKMNGTTKATISWSGPKK